MPRDSVVRSTVTTARSKTKRIKRTRRRHRYSESDEDSLTESDEEVLFGAGREESSGKKTPPHIPTEQEEWEHVKAVLHLDNEPEVNK